jgi:hypothetical protein
MASRKLDGELRGAHGPTNWRSGPWRIVPYVFAVTTGFQLLRFLYLQPYTIGFDARLYTDAARAWLAGGDPWAVSTLGVYFAAPPPTLLAFAPFTVLSPLPVSVLWVVGSFILAAAAVRSLSMPLWWLAFWPIVDGAMIGNPDVAVLALLVLGRGRFAAIAPVLKIYAFAPMIAERRLRPVAIATALLAVSAFILPWSNWFAQLPTITEHLKMVSSSTSVFGNPIAMILAVVALLALGFRRAGWLAVPALWPYTQVHYLAASAPALSPLLAIAWSFPHPAVVLGSLVAEAVFRRFQSGEIRSSAPARVLARWIPARIANSAIANIPRSSSPR